MAFLRPIRRKEAADRAGGREEAYSGSFRSEPRAWETGSKGRKKPHFASFRREPETRETGSKGRKKLRFASFQREPEARETGAKGQKKPHFAGFRRVTRKWENVTRCESIQRKIVAWETGVEGRGGACSHWFRRASMTVECALVLPFTLMIVLVLASYMNAVAFQVSRSLMVSNTARKAAALAGLAEVEGEGNWIDLCLPCRYEYPCSFLGLGGLTVAVRARVFPWVGKMPGEEEAKDDGRRTVYVTENRGVYHTYADCTHLDLTIYETSLDKVGKLRNSDGKRYKPCAGFPSDYRGPIYVSRSGRYYFPTMEAAGLTRHVSMVSEDECGDLCICSRCAARAAAEGRNAA